MAANRRARKWRLREQVVRILCGLAYPIFRLSPRPFYWGWRRVVLRICGAKTGKDVHIYPIVGVAIPWNLDIGEDAAVSDRAILYSVGPTELALVRPSHRALTLSLVRTTGAIRHHSR